MIEPYRFHDASKDKKRRHEGRRSKAKKGKYKVLHTATSLVALAASMPNKNQTNMRFDTDSRTVKIDNCASATMSPYVDEFEGELKATTNEVHGVGGRITNGIMKGTYKLKIEDDDGKAHTIRIPNSYYVPNLPCTLLSPQHWAREANDHKPMRKGTWCATYENEVVIQWNQRKHTKTIRLEQGTGQVASFLTTPGYKAFNAFMVDAQMNDDDIICYSATEFQ